MEAISGLAPPLDWQVSIEECNQLWTVFGDQLLAALGAEINQFTNNTIFTNCTELVHAYDRDGNDQLNSYEIVFIWNANSTRSKQINCSLCYEHVSDYYAY